MICLYWFKIKINIDIYFIVKLLYVAEIQINEIKMFKIKNSHK